MQKFFHEKNTYLIDHPVNVTFEEVLWKTDSEFEEWVNELKSVVVDIWDNHGVPPVRGFTEKEIKEQFKQLESFPVHKFLIKDEHTDTYDVIKNRHTHIGLAVNAWFDMMKVPIYGRGSAYDLFSNPKFERATYLSFLRTFKKDSYYKFSFPIQTGEVLTISGTPYKVTDATEFVNWFEENVRDQDTHDYWLKPIKEKNYKGYDENYTGYAGNVQQKLRPHLTTEQIEELGIPDKCKTNMDSKYDNYYVMLFEKGKKLFPAMLRSFMLTLIQVPVNFPPLTAKFLYERYSREFTGQSGPITILDPSSGWGGRILGAMSVRSNCNIHYVGTDPNTNHTIVYDNGTVATKYEDIAKFYNKVKNNGTFFPKEHTYEIFQLGSEVIANEPKFQKYKGKVNIAFTSPPYFAKEMYSEDDTQSYKKFSTYDSWVNGFLQPTLEMCYNWLCDGGYLLWNVADARFGNTILPIEDDSTKIIKSLGFEYVETMKLALAQMPGQNRVNHDTGIPKVKNFCKIKGEWLKYEPVFVWRKI